jgi:hypothetical protein
MTSTGDFGAGHQQPDRFDCQRADRDLEDRLPESRQFGEEHGHGFAGNDLLRSEGEHQRSGRRPPGDQAQGREAGGVRPLEVVDQDERPLGRGGGRQTGHPLQRQRPAALRIDGDRVERPQLLQFGKDVGQCDRGPVGDGPGRLEIEGEHLAEQRASQAPRFVPLREERPGHDNGHLRSGGDLGQQA